MNDITPSIKQGKTVIESYGGGRFRISGQVHDGGVIVLENEVHAWDCNDAGALSLDSLSTVINAAPRPEILLIGMGDVMQLLDPELRAALSAEGIVADGMDTGAACRTFNVLQGEDRRVAAALIAIS